MTTKTLALTLALLPALAGARDLRPGTFEIGAGTDLSFGTTTFEQQGFEDQDVSTFTVNADALYYLVNNLGVGLLFSYDRQKIEEAGVSDEASQTLIGPQAKFNIPLAPRASVLLRGALARSTQDFGDAGDADGFAFILGGGLRFFPTDWVSLDATLDYTNGSIEDDFNNELDFSSWDVNVGFSFYFGGR